MEQKRCISSLTLAELTAELKAMGQPGFRQSRSSTGCTRSWSPSFLL